MKDKWYADKRDLVKWGSIVSIAKAESIRTIIQVALYRPEKNTADISIDDGKKSIPVEFPNEVWDHFRNIEDIQRLEEKTNLKIIVHKVPFKWNNRFKSKEKFRLQYFEDLCSEIKKIPQHKIVVLDPDTGIAPKKSANFEHVLPPEIKAVFDSMLINDVLVFYQHARNREKNWKDTTKTQFKDALRTNNKIKTYRSNLADDVVFFMAKRSKPRKPKKPMLK